MSIAMIPLLEQLEDKPLEERPVLYACEKPRVFVYCSNTYISNVLCLLPTPNGSARRGAGKIKFAHSWLV